MSSRSLIAHVRRQSALPYLVALAILTSTAALAFSLKQREDAEMHRAVATKARSLAMSTRNRLADRTTELVRLAAMFPNRMPATDVWERESMRLLEMGAFRSVAWIDSLGNVVAMMPTDTAEGRARAPQLNSQWREVAQAARTTGRVSNSKPFLSSMGTALMVTAVPTARGVAALVAETALPTVLRQALETPDAAGYAFSVLADGKEIYVGRTASASRSTRWSEEAALDDSPFGWRLRLWPTETELSAHSTHLPEMVFLVGVLFAAGLAWTLRLYQTADNRAYALAKAYRRLEQETKERERAQEALERSEEQLRQSQKMEAVGRLAGGVAHDFNNLLTAINGYADFLLADIERSDPRRDDVREIKKAATRAGALTSQLLAFSRRQIRQPRLLDLNAVLADLEKMLRRVIGEDVTIDWQPSERLGSVRADPSEIEQILLNLVVNAGDAMPNGGTITVTTATVAFGEGSTHAQLAPGRYVRLRVCDTGMGMDAATRARIFEPFFTTKEPGKGTGLGLSTVYAIVENLVGAVDVDSTPGVGTTFTVYLPQNEGAADALASGTLTTLAPRGQETVLLVEDEEGVRALAARILERHGYTVLEARNGREALTVAAQHAGVIDLLLTDVVMPEMGGKQLAEALVTRDASLRVLFVSGYTDGDISRRGELDPHTAFLQKPFTARGLLLRVREVLDGDAIAA